MGENRINMPTPTTLQLIADLDALYTSILRRNIKEGILMSNEQIYQLMSESPAPRLYLSPDKAIRLAYNSSNKTIRICGHKFRSGLKHQEFYHRLSSLPPSMRTPKNIINLLEAPAPSFYLGPDRIKKLLYKVYDRRK